MSDTTLRELVLARLEKDTQPEDEWSALVLAALESPAPRPSAGRLPSHRAAV